MAICDYLRQRTTTSRFTVTFRATARTPTFDSDRVRGRAQAWRRSAALRLPILATASRRPTASF